MTHTVRAGLSAYRTRAVSAEDTTAQAAGSAADGPTPDGPTTPGPTWRFAALGLLLMLV